ncbi:hypothetical protein CERSUDRAFT_96901 [Gelatoporia subvermispora B]|uniref:DRBM domain-containing protein n=1 Tax=Ceriporiopsis subvermispora (strain B) TaxID=914234 RepID=M2R987_CERS8|nr:hypothetical protein CERSUDRAFT_96901 [Gelatoporia subvermispora B]
MQQAARSTSLFAAVHSQDAQDSPAWRNRLGELIEQRGWKANWSIITVPGADGAHVDVLAMIYVHGIKYAYQTDGTNTMRGRVEERAAKQAYNHIVQGLGAL